MFSKLSAMLICLSAVAWVHAETTGDFYVSPSGNDAWSGKSASANDAATDGPFASIERAQQAARLPSKPATILLRGGTYTLQKPLVFTPEDSRAVYAAYGDERPVISGGILLKGWKKNEKGWWMTRLLEVQRGEWNFAQLFVNGQRRYRPRLPKEGYFAVAEKVEPSAQAKGKGYDRFRFRAGDIRADWKNVSDVEVLGFQIWTMARLRIESVDDANRVVSFTGDTHHLDAWSELSAGKRYLVENVREALDRAGEWYLDRASGELTYIPLPGEDMEKSEIVAPKVEKLVQVKGNVPEKKYVEGLVFRGLTFAYTNWVTPAQGSSFAQAEAHLDGAISMEGARECAIEGCTIRAVGQYAIDFGAGCTRNRVEGCTLTDLGAGGVKIGLTGLEPNEEALCSHQTVRNNVIAHGGRLHPAAVGVWIGHSPYNVIEHNEIADLYYTGVSVGWSWGYGPSAAHHNTVAHNHIHHIGQGVLSDMGGIYTLGLAPGSILHHNLIHDIDSYDYGGWGIYFDEGTTGMVAENNVVYNTKTGGFHQHYGKENIVRNNVFANSRHEQIIRSRAEPHRSFTFERNIVYWQGGALLGSNWSGNNYTLDHNLYWRTDGKPIEFAKMSLQQWQASGQDAHSLIADPMFVNPEKEDFGLADGSPAVKIGFAAIDLREVGPAGGKRAEANVPAAFPTGMGR
jgi:hypothetical protein